MCFSKPKRNKIIILQVYAVYNRNKKLITVLAGTCLLFNIGALSMAIVYCPDRETD